MKTFRQGSMTVLLFILFTSIALSQGIVRHRTTTASATIDSQAVYDAMDSSDVFSSVDTLIYMVVLTTGGDTTGFEGAIYQLSKYPIGNSSDSTEYKVTYAQSLRIIQFGYGDYSSISSNADSASYWVDLYKNYPVTVDLKSRSDWTLLSSLNLEINALEYCFISDNKLIFIQSVSE